MDQVEMRLFTMFSPEKAASQEKLQDGSLSEERWLSYQKLKAENDYAADSESYLASKEKKFKEIAKYNKAKRKR